MTRMKTHIAHMLTLLPACFDAALLGYAESGTGRAIVLPVYDVDKLAALVDASSTYTMDMLAEWEEYEDPPLLLKRMSLEQANEQNAIYKFMMLPQCSAAFLGVVGTWNREECFLYDMGIASEHDEYKQNRILNHDLPGMDVCFLLGTNDEDLELIKTKADRYKYFQGVIE